MKSALQIHGSAKRLGRRFLNPLTAGYMCVENLMFAGIPEPATLSAFRPTLSTTHPCGIHLWHTWRV
jgi:hypothetical protein